MVGKNGRLMGLSVGDSINPRATEYLLQFILPSIVPRLRQHASGNYPSPWLAVTAAIVTHASKDRSQIPFESNQTVE
jgi:hypothetical protein